MTLKEMNIPLTIKSQAAELVRSIEMADGLLEVATAGGKTEGFLVGLKCVNALSVEDTATLEAIFDQAMERKMAETRKQR
ncbi:hypothetical protein G7013_05045 [Pseudomonas viridiflava]|uniref:hypothetical protein n=1 Tax=Pseudomonas viridiflava TaxID=33069 RepID=UPI0015E2E57E|nr:hypothetical protein [Pseudomonas viridiflava]MBA1229017.1 hypothetical protein [Pseudomonas viridiflava]